MCISTMSLIFENFVLSVAKFYTVPIKITNFPSVDPNVLMYVVRQTYCWGLLMSLDLNC